MINPNEAQLESIISAFIMSKYKDSPPTEAEFNEAADMMRDANNSLIPVNDEEFTNLKKRLREILKDAFAFT